MSRPWRVAVVAPRMTQVGGLQAYAWQVTRWLRDSSAHEVVVISTHPGRGIRRERLEGVDVVLLGTWLTLSNTPVNPLWWLQLKWLLSRLRIDAVDAHSPVPGLPDLAILAAGRRPSVLTYHAGSMVKNGGRGLVDRLLLAYERHVLPRVMARAGALVAASPTALVAQDPRAEVITPGVDLDVFRPGPPAGTRQRTIGFVGVLKESSRWKGVDVLLDALGEVPDAQLVMVGGGDLVPTLQTKAARLGVAERITWHGELPPPAVADVLAGVGVLALPSLTDAESFGMVLVEAMAAGTPVVGAAVGGIPYVIRDGVDGLLVPPGDAAALAAALRSVLDDPVGADRLGAAGRHAAEQRWSWDHQRARTLALLSRPAAAERRVRLAVVTDAVAPWHTGGKEQRQHELWTRLAADHDIDVHVHTMKWWEGPGTIVRDGVTFHALMPLVPLYAGARRSILQAIAFAMATLRMISRRYDVLEVDAIPFLQLFPARVVAWLRRRPMAVTWHEFWGRDYWVRYLGPLGHVAAVVERTAALLPDHVVAVSEGTAERVRAAGATSVSLITPGIARAQLPVAPRREPRARIELLCAGRLLEHKRVDVAIDACAELIARGHGVRLRVIGAGPAAEALAAQARAAAPEAIEMIDFLPAHRDVLLAMAAADVVLFPSEREGFGMVGLEALAMGTPVVTSSHPDNFARHLIRDGVNGVVCDNTATAVADSVERIVKEHDLYAAGARASAARFEWDEIAERSAAAYRSLLG